MLWRAREGTVSRSRPRATLPPPPLTEAGLAALYNDCNRTRFGGRLPRAVVEWHQSPPGMMASTHPNSALGPSIWIHPLFAAVSGKAWVRRTLLHEMCHVEVGTDGGGPEPGHGPRWRAAMLRLRKQGERWVGPDLANASAAEAEADARLRPILKAMEKLDRSLPFHQVLELLVQQFGRRRGRQFGHPASALIQSDVRVVEHWSRLGGRF